MQVDYSLSELDRHVPSLVKQASSQARALAWEVQRAGMVDAAKSIAKTMYTKYEPTAKELYCKYEPVAEQYAVSAWHALNLLPLFPRAAEVAVPTAAYWSEVPITAPQVHATYHKLNTESTLSTCQRGLSFLPSLFCETSD